MLKRGAFAKSLNPCDNDLSISILINILISINMVSDWSTQYVIKNKKFKLNSKIPPFCYFQQQKERQSVDYLTMQKYNNFHQISGSQELQICNLIEKCKHIVRQDRLYLRNILKIKHGAYYNPQEKFHQQGLIKIFMDYSKPLNKMHMYQKDMKQLQLKLRKYVNHIKKTIKEQQMYKMKENSSHLVQKETDKNKQKLKGYFLENRSRISSNNQLQNRQNLMFDSRSNSISNTSKSGKSSNSHRKYPIMTQQKNSNIARNNPNQFNNSSQSTIFIKSSNTQVDERFRDVSFTRNNNSSINRADNNSQKKFREQISSVLKCRQNKSIERQKPKMSQTQATKAIVSKRQWNLKLRQNQAVYAKTVDLKKELGRSPMRDTKLEPSHIKIQNHSLNKSNSNKKTYLDSLRNDQIIEEVPSYRQIDNQKQKSYMNVYKKSTKTQNCQVQSEQQNKFVSYLPLFYKRSAQKQQQRASLTRPNNKAGMEHRKSKSKDDFPVKRPILSQLISHQQVVSIPTQYQQFQKQHQHKNKKSSLGRDPNFSNRNEEFVFGNKNENYLDYDNKFSFRENSLQMHHQSQQKRPMHLLNSRAASAVSQSFEQSNLKIRAMLQGSRRLIDQFQKQKQRPFMVNQAHPQNSYTVEQSKYAGSITSEYLLGSFKESSKKFDQANSGDKPLVSLAFSQEQNDKKTKQFHSFKPSVDFDYSDSSISSNRNFDGNKFKEIQMTSSLYKQHQSQVKQKPQSNYLSSTSQNLFTSPELLEQCRNFMKKSKKSSHLFNAKPLLFPPIQETNIQNQSSQRQSFAEGQPNCYNILQNINEDASIFNNRYNNFLSSRQQASSGRMELNSFRQDKNMSTNPFDTSISPLRVNSNQNNLRTAQQIVSYFFKGQNSPTISSAKFKLLFKNLPIEIKNLLNCLTYRQTDISIFDVAAQVKSLEHSASLSKDLLAILDLDVAHRQIVTPSNIQIFLQNLSAVGLPNFNQIQSCLWRVFRKSVQSDLHAKQISEKQNRTQIGYWQLYYLQINEDADFKVLCQTLGNFQFQIEIYSDDDE